MPKKSTFDFEQEAREELLSSIGALVDISPGTNNAFLEEEFGINDSAELQTLSMSRLLEITSRVESIF